MKPVQIVLDGNVRVKALPPVFNERWKIRNWNQNCQFLPAGQFLDLFFYVHPPVRFKPVGENRSGQQYFHAKNRWVPKKLFGENANIMYPIRKLLKKRAAKINFTVRGFSNNSFA